jgi:hypothetical protein
VAASPPSSPAPPAETTTRLIGASHRQLARRSAAHAFTVGPYVHDSHYIWLEARRSQWSQDHIADDVAWHEVEEALVPPIVT